MRRSFSGKIRADRLESGGRLQKPEPLLEGATPLSFFTDAKAEAGRAWIGGFLELVEGCPRCLVLARSGGELGSLGIR